MKALLRMLLLLLPVVAAAEERILDFHSDIVVRQDGSIEVTETITARAEGVSIRRGIYRDFPTRYRDRFGNDVEVVYRPKSVMRDGRSEDFHTERRGNGVRAYFGSADRMVAPGEHTWVFRYDASRMLGFFDSSDELYWNVTGLGWGFPIDHASARVTFGFDLPPGSLGVDAFTGAFGQQGRDYDASTEAGAANFETTRVLAPGEGLTIVVNWPKGHVEEPGTLQRIFWLLSDNANLLLALAGLLAVLGYYLPVWSSHGKDPEKGLVVTRYEPPQGFSPASLRFIERMGYDHKAMTAAIVNLAVKGYLRIENVGDEHVLQRLTPGPEAIPMATGEKELLAALFREGDRIELKQENHEVLGKALAVHGNALKRDYAKRYFRTNGAMNLPAILIALAASIIALNLGGPSPIVIGLIIAMLLVIVLFAFLMRRPTPIGRKVLDEAAGFREYLEIAEKDEMNLKNPPEKTPQLFERYLPYALAMGVEQRWAERFAEVFANLRGPGGAPYHPSWYSGSFNAGNFSLTTAALSSGLGSAISSSVTPPGSSSGSGGGGFSGGGGGGGGGGGW